MHRALVAAFCLLLLLAPGAATATERGAGAAVELEVLSYNVHGLPGWIAGDAPTRRMPRIGERMNAYDLVLVQEDWVHHALLRRKATHGIVVHGGGARSPLLAGFGPFCGACGSGLSLLARKPEPALRLVQREAFRHCSGWLRDGSDCFATKGYLMLRLQLSSGAELDVWNVHLDAGRSESDHAARVAQLELLREHIAQISDGRALVLGGDFNLSIDRERDLALLLEFRKALSLEDSGAVRAAASRWKERIDHIFLRSGRDVALQRLDAGEALEFVEDDVPLSDHPALRARLRVTLRPTAEALHPTRR